MRPESKRRELSRAALVLPILILLGTPLSAWGSEIPRAAVIRVFFGLILIIGLSGGFE